MNQADLLKSFGYNPEAWVILTYETIKKYQLEKQPGYNVHTYGIIPAIGKKEFLPDSRIVKKDFVLRYFPEFDFEANRALNQKEREALVNNNNSSNKVMDAPKEAVVTPEEKEAPKAVIEEIEEKPITDEEKITRHNSRVRELVDMGYFFDFRIKGYKKGDKEISNDFIFNANKEEYSEFMKTIRGPIDNSKNLEAPSLDPLPVEEIEAVEVIPVPEPEPEPQPEPEPVQEEKPEPQPEPQPVPEPEPEEAPQQVPQPEVAKEDPEKQQKGISSNGFFESLSNLKFQQINFTVIKEKENNITVLFKPVNYSGDDTYDNLKPLVINSVDPRKLDSNFFEIIFSNLEEADKIISNAKAFIDDLNARKKKDKEAQELKEKVKKALEKADKFYNKEDFDFKKSYKTALKNYKDVIELDPNNKKALEAIKAIEEKEVEMNNKLI